LYSVPPCDPEAFSHPFLKKLLIEARSRVNSRVEPWVLCVRTYRRARGICGWTLKTLEDLGLRANPELFNRIFIFVSHEDPDFTSGSYVQALGPEWASRIVVGVKGADRQTRFIEECFCAQQHVVVCDDNITWLKRDPLPGSTEYCEMESDPCELDRLIERAGLEMARYDAHLWSICPHANGNWRKSHNSVPNQDNVDTKLGLVYGAFFGFVCLHEQDLYTHFGAVKDDVERTLRYWHRDRVVLRFLEYAVHKAQPPGNHKKTKGGISATLTCAAHKRQAKQALLSMQRGFASPYILLDEKVSTGVKWSGQCTARFRSVRKEPSPVMLDYMCKACSHTSAATRRSSVCRCVRSEDAEAFDAFSRELAVAIAIMQGEQQPPQPNNQSLIMVWAEMSDALRLPYYDLARLDRGRPPHLRTAVERTRRRR